MRDGKNFSQLIEEYGTQELEEEVPMNTETEIKTTKISGEGRDVDVSPDVASSEVNQKVEKGSKSKPPASKLMSEEERNRGAVSLSVYAKYLRYAGGVIWAPVIVGILTLLQGASGKHNFFFQVTC